MLRGVLAFESTAPARVHFDFGGVIQSRIRANTEHWLLTAPQANPGLLGMFQVRDRHPVPSLVPWAGEFVGKYLLASIQALRMTDDSRLRLQVSNVVTAFIATQADDGYLGPFPKEIRLLKNWDLWGHYHAIQALLAWHEQTGDPAALTAARRAGDLVCRTYLRTGRRTIEAGDPEMNLSILTAMAMLHRFTGEPTYLEMAREVEKDWEQAGDYLRSGLDGREFFQSPRPRWESLHDLQGLVELWRITGDRKYRDSFIHHWRSIRRWDRRNTGGFSSGEQATGNPYANTAIETCCTVAWMAITLDYLRLTGDPLAADDLELATYNGGLGAQHPSGRWWTYNTPMDGSREASAHTIVFQSRAGTPEFNCCSANAPRVLGVLSEWALQTCPDGLVLNWLAPMTARVRLADGTECQLTVTGDHPRSGNARISLQTTPARRDLTLKIRIPAWAQATGYQLSAGDKTETGEAAPGTYLSIKRPWQSSDALTLSWGESLRAIAGASDRAGQASIYRGPLLLAYDQRFNAFDDHAIPALNLSRLGDANLSRLGDAKLAPAAPANATGAFVPEPWLALDLPAANGSTVRLVDFANAGAEGTQYRSWLPVMHPAPPPAMTQLPPDAARLQPGPTQFRWQFRQPRGNASSATAGPAPINFRLEFAADTEFHQILLATNTAPAKTTRIELDTRTLLARTERTNAPADLYWRVIAVQGELETIPDVPPALLRLDPSAPPQHLPPEPKTGPAGELVRHSLRDGTAPEFGLLLAGSAGTGSPEGTTLDGHGQKLLYPINAWPGTDFSVAVRVRIAEIPRGRIGQIFSAWTASNDDPLRLVVDAGKLHARIEGSGGASTPGVAVEAGRWMALAVVKADTRLALYMDGREVASTTAPALVTTASQLVSLGGNPRYGGDEHLAATFADFGFWARALSTEEIQARSHPHP